MTKISSVPVFVNEDAFFCRFFLDIGGVRDTSGRPLHEVDFRFEEHPGAFEKCPFHDSRKGYLINKDALVQITSEWPEVLRGVRYFKRLFDVPGQPATPLERAWVISLAAMFAPVYLLSQGSVGLSDEQIPTPVAGVFKIMLDVPTTIDLMLMEGASRAEDASGVLAVRSYADETRILLNGEYACAGSPRLIDNVLNIFEEPAEPIVGKGEGVFALIGDVGRYREYCHLMTIQYVLSLTYIITTSFAAQRTTERSGPAPGNLDPAAVQPSAFERRTKLMMEVMSRAGSRHMALRRLIGLAADHRIWGTKPQEADFAISFVETSLAFLDEMAGQSPATTRAAYDRYHAAALKLFGTMHDMIEHAIGAQRIFARPTAFSAVGRHPLLA